MFAKANVTIISTLMLSASLPAAAQDIDLDQLPCSQFLESDPTAAKDIVSWLAGYYTYADDLAIRTDITVPTQDRSLLHGDPRGDVGRQNAISIGNRLKLENVPRRHRDHP